MSTTNAVTRFVFKELKPGDLLKFNAMSASSGTGGGARDQRFSPYTKFDPVFAAMFKKHETKNRKMRDGTVLTSTIYVANVSVHIDDTYADAHDPHVVQNGGASYLIETLKYWPPTKGRGNEGRLGQVSKLRLAPPSDEGRVFLMIFEDGTLISPRLAFVTEAAVKASLWHKAINDFFAKLIADPPAVEAVMGFKDYVAKTSWTKTP